MRVTFEPRLRPSSTELSSLRDARIEKENARSSSIASSLQDAASIKAASPDGSGVELAAGPADSDVGYRPRRSFLQLSLAAAVGIFALLATAAFAFSVLLAGLATFLEDETGNASTLDAGDRAVVVSGEREVGPAPKPHIKYGFEDEPVHWGESGGEGLDLGANPEKAMPDPRCGQFRFSFCSERKGGAYFDPTLASCLPVSAEIVYVCNRSPNRFSSLHKCRRSCVETARPHRRCMATPEFSHCSRACARPGAARCSRALVSAAKAACGRGTSCSAATSPSRTSALSGSSSTRISPRSGTTGASGASRRPRVRCWATSA
ncbi:uncharacterized protein [Dermacentor albipictus]|uniref:uncharacterized protein isoform X3 n=1 Tax=Dermacentor albipictus TaxID=60249 RepID=UPI0031FDB9F2